MTLTWHEMNSNNYFPIPDYNIYIILFFFGFFLKAYLDFGGNIHILKIQKWKMPFFSPKNNYNKTEFVRSTVCREEAKLHLCPRCVFTRGSLTKIQINKRKTSSLLMHSLYIIWKKAKNKSNSKWWLGTLVYTASSTKENIFVEEWLDKG